MSIVRGARAGYKGDLGDSHHGQVTSVPMGMFWTSGSPIQVAFNGHIV